MTTIDNRISSALSDDDRAFLESLDQERGMFRQMGDSLGGPLGGWAKLMMVVSVALGLFALFALWQVFHVSETRELILWAMGFLAAMVGQGFVKEWFFNRMNLITMLREMKRIQLEIALLKDG